MQFLDLHFKNYFVFLDPVTPIILKSSGFRVMSQTLKTNVTIGEDVEVIFGSEVYINCPFKAEPEGTVMWSGEDSTDLQRRGAVEVNDGKSLLILTATEKSSGVYQCIVSNVFGSDIAKTVLTVGGRFFRSIQAKPDWFQGWNRTRLFSACSKGDHKKGGHPTITTPGPYDSMI